MDERELSGSSLNVAHNDLRFMMIDILHKACYLKIKYSKVPEKKVEYLTKEELKKILSIMR